MHAYARALALLLALLPVALGETLWSEPGGAPSFANASNAPAEFLRIDLKTAPAR